MPTGLARDIEHLSRLARTREIRIAVVESLTSGGLAHAVGAGEGASDWFAGGIVAYMTDVKEHLLGMTPGVDPCSADCAEQLAAGGLELFAADLCVSTTGVGGPEREGGHEAGTVYLGWAMDHVRGHLQVQLQGEPSEVLDKTVSAAAHLLVARADDFHRRPEHAGATPTGATRTDEHAPEGGE